MMRPKRADQPGDLFKSSEAPTQLCDQHRQRVMQAMLLEILPTTTSKEVSGDEGQL